MSVVLFIFDEALETPFAPDICFHVRGLSSFNCKAPVKPKELDGQSERERRDRRDGDTSYAAHQVVRWLLIKSSSVQSSFTNHLEMISD